MNKSIPKNKDKDVRMSCILPKYTTNKIKVLRSSMGNATNSRVISVSLEMLACIAQANNNGHKMYFQDESGNQRGFEVKLKKEMEVS